MVVNYALDNWSCKADDGRCPGAFQAGCDADANYPYDPTSAPTAAPTAAPTDAPTDGPDSGASSTFTVGLLTMIVAFIKMLNL